MIWGTLLGQICLKQSVNCATWIIPRPKIENCLIGISKKNRSKVSEFTDWCLVEIIGFLKNFNSPAFIGIIYGSIWLGSTKVSHNELLQDNWTKAIKWVMSFVVIVWKYSGFPKISTYLHSFVSVMINGTEVGYN